MRTPKPFTVFQPIPGQNPKPLFIVHAYSLAQARAIVAAKARLIFQPNGQSVASCRTTYFSRCSLSF